MSGLRLTYRWQGSGTVLEGGPKPDIEFFQARILRNPGVELNGGAGDLVFPDSVSGTGSVSVFTEFDSESSLGGTALQVDVDIGNEGETDCTTEITVKRGGSPGSLPAIQLFPAIPGWDESRLKPPLHA